MRADGCAGEDGDVLEQVHWASAVPLFLFNLLHIDVVFGWMRAVARMERNKASVQRKREGEGGRKTQ